jgi:hypothetical protein
VQQELITLSQQDNHNPSVLHVLKASIVIKQACQQLIITRDVELPLTVQLVVLRVYQLNAQQDIIALLALLLQLLVQSELIQMQ